MPLNPKTIALANKHKELQAYENCYISDENYEL